MPTFAAPDGSALAYDAYEPDAPARLAVLVTHGWGDHAGRHSWLGARLRDAGVATFAADLRGHGRSPGQRGHLSRFSQLLGDLQAFRRAIRARHDVPQVLLGHGFGALVVLRYLETEPSRPPAAAVVAAPLLTAAYGRPMWQRAVELLASGIWHTLPLPDRLDEAHLSRDPAAGAAFGLDPAVHRVATVGARRETAWAQRAVVADAGRIAVPLLFLLAGEDHIADAQAARALAASVRAVASVRWYAEMYHDLFTDPQRECVMTDLLGFLAQVADWNPDLGRGVGH